MLSIITQNVTIRKILFRNLTCCDFFDSKSEFFLVFRFLHINVCFKKEKEELASFARLVIGGVFLFVGLLLVLGLMMAVMAISFAIRLHFLKIFLDCKIG